MSKVDELVERMINKMLEKHGVDMDYVKEHPEINGEPWYSYYTWTTEESDKHKEWAIPEIRKVIRRSQKAAESEYAFFNLQFGLKIKDQ